MITLRILRNTQTVTETICAVNRLYKSEYASASFSGYIVLWCYATHAPDNKNSSSFNRK